MSIALSLTCGVKPLKLCPASERALHELFAASGQRISPPPLALPPRAPGFVGRQEEIARLVTLLREGQDVGLSASVAGMGGVGKSALAAEALARLAIDPRVFAGGIGWVRCNDRRGLSGLALVYDQVLSQWGIALTREDLASAATPDLEVEARERALCSRLRLAGPAVLLLDNVEPELPLPRALALFTSLGMRLLVTSRHEPVTPALRVLRLDVLGPDEAAALFIERYRDKRGQYDEARDRLSALEVVDALGGLPLAIELAAARAGRQQMPVRRLAQDLREPALLEKLKDPLDHSASVRASLALSLATLTEAQQARFAALSLPEGADWSQAVRSSVCWRRCPPRERQRTRRTTSTCWPRSRWSRWNRGRGACASTPCCTSWRASTRWWRPTSTSTRGWPPKRPSSGMPCARQRRAGSILSRSATSSLDSLTTSLSEAIGAGA